MSPQILLRFSFLILVISQLFSGVTANGQTHQKIGLDDLLENLYPTMHQSSHIDSVIHKQKGAFTNASYIQNKNTLTLETDSTEDVKHIYINNHLVDTIYPGNEETSMDFSGLSFEDNDIEIFTWNKTTFFVLHPFAKGCNGSFCRVCTSFLIGTDSLGKPLAFYFETTESPPRFFFRVSKKGALIYLDMENSFSDNDLNPVLDEGQPDGEFILYKIEPLVFYPEKMKWIKKTDEKAKPYNVVFKSPDQYETCDGSIQNINWPKEELGAEIKP